jgi:hypothetical protein
MSAGSGAETAAAMALALVGAGRAVIVVTAAAMGLPQRRHVVTWPGCTSPGGSRS